MPARLVVVDVPADDQPALDENLEVLGLPTDRLPERSVVWQREHRGLATRPVPNASTGRSTRPVATMH